MRLLYIVEFMIGSYRAKSMYGIADKAYEHFARLRLSPGQNVVMTSYALNEFTGIYDFVEEFSWEDGGFREIKVRQR